MASDALGQQAYRVVEELSVHIGPRPAGSAVDYLEDKLGHESPVPAFHCTIGGTRAYPPDQDKA